MMNFGALRKAVFWVGLLTTSDALYAATNNTQLSPLPAPQSTLVEQLYQDPYAPKRQLAHYVLFDQSVPHVVAYVTGGAFASDLSNNPNVTIDQYNTINTYNSDTKWNVLMGVGVGVGYITYPYPYENFKVTINPAFYFVNYDSVSGIEHPDSGSGIPFDTLSYQFNAKSYVGMLETHLAYAKYAWQPVVILGIGVADNYLSGFSSVATDPDGSASPGAPFPDNSNFSFAYEVGCGVWHTVMSNAQHEVSFGLEYRYFNTGKGELGAAPSGDHLTVQTMDAQSILASLGIGFS